MTPSKYLDKFTHLHLQGAHLHEIVGDTLLVEKIIEEQKTASGLVLAADPRTRNSLTNDRPHFVRVLAVGMGYYNEETGAAVPLEVEPGDIILVGSLSVKWFSMFGITGYEADTIGLSRASEIQLRFKGAHGYDQAFNLLNQASKDPVF